MAYFRRVTIASVETLYGMCVLYLFGGGVRVSTDRAKEMARSLHRNCANIIQVADHLRIRAVMCRLDTPDDAIMFEVGGNWILIYSPETTNARIAHLLGHHMLHRERMHEFLNPGRHGKIDDEAQEIANILTTA
jgi:hypothetical protein